MGIVSGSYRGYKRIRIIQGCRGSNMLHDPNSGEANGK